MAFYLERQKTGSTPYILIDEENHSIKFEGESFHEDIISFFSEVNSWLDSYLDSDFGSLTFECALTYFNSSTAKLLFNMLNKMDEATNGNNKVTVNWVALEENEFAIENGEDFEEDMENLEFNLILT